MFFCLFEYTLIWDTASDTKSSGFIFFTIDFFTKVLIEKEPPAFKGEE